MRIKERANVKKVNYKNDESNSLGCKSVFISVW